jgi:hypothetical protein
VDGLSPADVVIVPAERLVPFPSTGAVPMVAGAGKPARTNAQNAHVGLGLGLVTVRVCTYRRAPPIPAMICWRLQVRAQMLRCACSVRVRVSYGKGVHIPISFNSSNGLLKAAGVTAMLLCCDVDSIDDPSIVSSLKKPVDPQNVDTITVFVLIILWDGCSEELWKQFVSICHTPATTQHHGWH